MLEAAAAVPALHGVRVTALGPRVRAGRSLGMHTLCKGIQAALDLLPGHRGYCAAPEHLLCRPHVSAKMLLAGAEAGD